MTQAARIKERLSDELGTSGAFPAPALLAQLSAPQPGLTATNEVLKIWRRSEAQLLVSARRFRGFW